MDSSPSKRRKVSPTVGVAVNVSNTGNVFPTRDARSMTPGRSSFMSPTKASLSRHNPSLLPRPKSAGEGAQKDELREGQSGIPGRASSPRKLNPVSLRPTTPQKRPEQLSASPSRAVPRVSASPVRVGSISPRKTQSIGGRLSLPARRQSRTPGKIVDPQAATSSPTRHLTPTQLEPLQESEEAASNQLVQELQATATVEASPSSLSARASLAQQEDNDEPQLPPTPEQLGLVPRPSPPRGLMSNSPMKRKSKRRAVNKSSPLKPRDETTVAAHETHAPTTNTGKGVDDGQDGETHEAEDPKDDEEVMKRKAIYKTLLAQLEATQRDVEVLETAVVAVQNTPALELNNVHDLVPILVSTNPTHKPLPPAPKPLSLSMRLAQFLPFSGRKQPKLKTSEEPERPLPSYHPIVVDDPITQLQAFTPLTLTTVEKVVITSLGRDHLRRQQNLSLTDPLSLLSVDLGLTIAASTNSVVDLTLPKIAPWADEELGSWIRSQLNSGDIPTIGWACGRYWDLALLRATTWSRCCEKYSDLISIASGRARAPLAEKAAQGPSKLQWQSQGKIPGLNAPSKLPPSDLPRATIHFHLGRQTLRFSRGSVFFAVHWVIGFDWTGEAQSHVSASAAFPQVWRDVDERRSLSKVKAVFRQLVGERGVMEAVRVIVGLVFPEE